LYYFKIDQENRKRIHITWNAAKTSHVTITDTLKRRGYVVIVVPQNETSTGNNESMI
jgi:hypothetical protein